MEKKGDKHTSLTTFFLCFFFSNVAARIRGERYQTPLDNKRQQRRRVGTIHVLQCSPQLPKTEGGVAPVPFWPCHRTGRRSRPGQHLHHIGGPGCGPAPPKSLTQESRRIDLKMTTKCFLGKSTIDV